MRNAPYQKSSGRSQSNSYTIQAGYYAIEYTLQPLETEWSVPNLMHHGFRVTPEFNEFDDVELYLTIPKRIPSINIISAQFENDLQTISFAAYRGEELLRSKEGILLTEIEPEVNGFLYTEASILKKSYMHKYKFRAVLKQRRRSQPQPQPQRPTPPPPETRPAAPPAEGINETLQRLKKLESITEQLVNTIEELTEKIEEGIPVSTAPASTVELQSPTDHESEFESYIRGLDHRFTDQTGHILAEAAKVIPPELLNNPSFQMFQKLRQALATNNAEVQALKQANACFRLPVLKFSANVDEAMKKIKGPGKEVDVQSIKILSFDEYLHSDFIDFLCQWLDKDVEPPIEAFNPEQAYRQYVFKNYQIRLREVKEESRTNTFSKEALDAELEKITRQSLIQHLDEIEKLEKSHKAEIPDLPVIVDQYIKGILNALNMKMIPAKRGDLFDPKLHENQNSTIPAGSMVQQVVHRGILDTDNKILKRVKVIT
ncbi:MAG: hypothetical protein C4527_10415 [Candidatus Omnitrophota bacterium]|nr:MAG: hypothetical protein C4527_10415 [Candidatus Omnitrophota bacterium]